VLISPDRLRKANRPATRPLLDANPRPICDLRISTSLA
jgi:hypothetical protein